MSDTGTTIAEIPFFYTVRHLPTGLKQPVTSRVRETSVARVALVGEALAPVVAILTPGHKVSTVAYGHFRGGNGREADLEQRGQVVYRAARGSDGVVRLIAPLDSQAFRNPLANEGDQYSYQLPSQLVYPGAKVSARDVVRSVGTDLGTEISSDRGHAIAGLRSRIPTLVSVDGVLHAPCAEPGWVFSPSRNDYSARARNAAQNTYLHLNPSMFDNASYSSFTDKTSAQSYPAHFIPVNSAMDDACKFMECRGIIHRSSGRLEEVIPNILGADPMWGIMRGVLAMALAVAGQEPLNAFGGEEMLLRQEMTKAIHTWPAARDLELVAKAVRMVRICHSVVALGNATPLKMATKIERIMQGPAPIDLETRLRMAGYTLESVPDDEVDLGAMNLG